jgi:hypothetical protein
MVTVGFGITLNVEVNDEVQTLFEPISVAVAIVIDAEGGGVLLNEEEGPTGPPELRAEGVNSV